MRTGPDHANPGDTPRIVLVTCPTLTEHADPRIVEASSNEEDTAVLSPPLGTAVVAALFRQRGWAVTAIDSNREYMAHLAGRRPQASFARALAERLARHESPYYGFSTICSTYPLTLRVAESLKLLAPRSTILFGGPQASATAAETLRTCPYVDFVIRGEVEGAIGPFARRHADAPEEVPGLCWRDADGVHLNAPPPAPDVALIPFPAYDLWPIAEANVLFVEGGRGCPFGCRFCSTSAFFGRSHRLRPPAGVIEDVLRLHAAYGTRRISIVHDNLFLHERECLDFCGAWTSDARLAGITWSCSLRPDAVTPRMAQALADARCGLVFVGLETGSRRLQQVIGKRIDLARASDSLAALHAAGVSTTTAFIIGFPEETRADLRDTCALLLRMLRTPSSKPQVFALAVLAKSGYDAPSAWPLERGGPMSALAHQGSPIPSELASLIDSSPTLFSSHHPPRLRRLDRPFVAECEYFLRYAVPQYRWLLVLMAHCLNDDLLTVLELWSAFVGQRPARASRYDYYTGPAFGVEFNEFAMSVPSARGFRSSCLEPYRFLSGAYREPGDALFGEIQASCARRQGEFSVGGTVEGAFVLREAEYSVGTLVDALVSGRAVERVRPSPSRLLWYRRHDRLTLEEPAPLTVAILDRMRTRRLVSDLVRELSDTSAGVLPAGLRDRREEAFLFAVRELCALGVLRSAPLRVLLRSEAPRRTAPR